MGVLMSDRTGSDVSSSGRGSGLPLKLIIALVIAAFSLITYFSNTSYNPITQEKQHVAISPDQEIAIGLQSAPEMSNEYGGQANDAVGQARVSQIGSSIVANSDAGKTPYKFKFHLLADNRTINAFALPGGQVFITEGLYRRLDTPGEVAGVLAHEIGHVAARHSAQHIAKQQLTQGLTGAAVLATYDPNDPNSRNNAEIAAVVASLVNLKFGRADELEADKLGVRFESEAGYDPRSMIKVMEILQAASKTRTPEFFSTHPNPEHRIERIKEAIADKYPNGVPAGMKQ
jgi:predicted Zn-dependent protease